MIKKLGIVSLRVVSPEVMPVPELTGNLKKKELSLPMGREPGNQTKKREQNAENVQLNLFDYDLFGKSISIPSSG